LGGRLFAGGVYNVPISLHTAERVLALRVRTHALHRLIRRVDQTDLRRHVELEKRIVQPAWPAVAGQHLPVNQDRIGADGTDAGGRAAGADAEWPRAAGADAGRAPADAVSSGGRGVEMKLAVELRDRLRHVAVRGQVAQRDVDVRQFDLQSAGPADIR